MAIRQSSAANLGLQLQKSDEVQVVERDACCDACFMGNINLPLHSSTNRLNLESNSFFKSSHRDAIRQVRGREGRQAQESLSRGPLGEEKKCPPSIQNKVNQKMKPSTCIIVLIEALFWAVGRQPRSASGTLAGESPPAWRTSLLFRAKILHGLYLPGFDC